MEFSWNPNTKYTEKPQSSISAHSFSDVPSFSKISKPSGQNQQIGQQSFLSPLSFKISLRDIYILSCFFINALGFYLSRMFVKFSLTCIFQLVLKKFLNLWCSHFWKIVESTLFYSCPSPPLKTPGRIFCFPQNRRGGRKLWFALSKFNQKIWRWLGTLVYFHLVRLQFF